MRTRVAHLVLLGVDQTVTGLYTGVRHSGKRWSTPRTTFMYAVESRWVTEPTLPSPTGKRSMDTMGVIS